MRHYYFFSRCLFYLVPEGSGIKYIRVHNAFHINGEFVFNSISISYTTAQNIMNWMDMQYKEMSPSDYIADIMLSKYIFFSNKKNQHIFLEIPYIQQATIGQHAEYNKMHLIFFFFCVLYFTFNNIALLLVLLV